MAQHADIGLIGLAVMGRFVRIDPDHRHNNAFPRNGGTEVGTPDSGR